jgi:hypothetical protein
MEKPSNLDKAVNFTKAVLEHAKSGFSEVDQMTQEQRLYKCKTCNEETGNSYYDENNGDPICQHKGCGCHLNEKVKWSTQSCPIKRWLEEEGKGPSGTFGQLTKSLLDPATYTFPANVFFPCCGGSKSEKE